MQSFRSAVGESPLRYILLLRIRNAQVLLETTDGTISEIARIVGYENSMYFSRLFRKEKGMSPLKYRKAFLEGVFDVSAAKGDFAVVCGIIIGRREGGADMFDREAAVSVFRAYTAGYAPENTMIRLKIVHTFRVAELCGRIAGSLGMAGSPLDLAWFLGLLHDIGRFEQVRRYGTFFDAKSVDHADFGADLLFREGLIERFPADSLPEGWRERGETAIRLHNKLTLPEDLDPETKVFAEILRDADKVDIFRVVSEIPLEERLGKSASEIEENEDLTPEVMACVYEHRCVPRTVRRTRFDNHISHGCMAFELVFEESRRIAAEQGFLDRLLAEKDDSGRQIWNEKETAALRTLRQELRRTSGS